MFIVNLIQHLSHRKHIQTHPYLQNTKQNSSQLLKQCPFPTISPQPSKRPRIQKLKTMMNTKSFTKSPEFGFLTYKQDPFLIYIYI